MKKNKKLINNKSSRILYIQPDGTKVWTYLSVPHREDGPAIVYASGTKEWWVMGMRHRSDGPAIESSTGESVWYDCDQLHRVDGAAKINSNGEPEYWYYGQKVSDLNELKLKHQAK